MGLRDCSLSSAVGEALRQPPRSGQDIGTKMRSASAMTACGGSQLKSGIRNARDQWESCNEICQSAKFLGQHFNPGLISGICCCRIDQAGENHETSAKT